jgi:transposase
MEPEEIVDDKFRMPDEMWERIEVLLPKRRRRKVGGRPPLPWRLVIDGIFYVLRTGCQWKAAPKAFGSGSSLHRYFQALVKRRCFAQLWAMALLEYDDLVGLEWKWQAMDGAMTKAPLGGGKNRAQSDRPGQTRDQAQRADRGPRRADRLGYFRGEHSRHAISGRDIVERADRGPQPRRRGPTPLPRQGVRLRRRAANGGRIRLHGSYPITPRGANPTT